MELYAAVLHLCLVLILFQRCWVLLSSVSLRVCQPVRNKIFSAHNEHKIRSYKLPVHCVVQVIPKIWVLYVQFAWLQGFLWQQIKCLFSLFELLTLPPLFFSNFRIIWEREKTFCSVSVKFSTASMKEAAWQVSMLHVLLEKRWRRQKDDRVLNECKHACRHLLVIKVSCCNRTNPCRSLLRELLLQRWVTCKLSFSHRNCSPQHEALYEAFYPLTFPSRDARWKWFDRETLVTK